MPVFLAQTADILALGAIFDGLLPSARVAGSRAITVDHNWNSFSRIIDVGGAYGSFLEALLLANEKPSGVLFDQEQVSVWFLSWPRP
jgi:hypothetical protein